MMSRVLSDLTLMEGIERIWGTRLGVTFEAPGPYCSYKVRVSLDYPADERDVGEEWLAAKIGETFTLIEVDNSARMGRYSRHLRIIHEASNESIATGGPPS